MYILFTRVSDLARGPVEVIGRYNNFDVGYIPTSHVDIVLFKHLDATVLPDDIALGCVFAHSYDSKISVRGSTLQADRLNQVSSVEGAKTKLTIAAEDLENGMLFQKAVLRKMIDIIFEERFSKLTASSFEMSTWPTQFAEATAGTGAMLTTLAAARSITVSEMATLILDASAIYNSTIATLLADKQTIEGEIKACASIADCLVFRHTRMGEQMPGPLATSLSNTSEPVFNI
jgi:hypothetical protein